MYKFLITIYLILLLEYSKANILYPPNYGNLCSDSDNTFLDPCDGDCFTQYTGYVRSPVGGYYLREDILRQTDISIQSSIQKFGDTISDIEFDDNYNRNDSIIVCRNARTHRSCLDYATSGLPVLCSPYMQLLLANSTSRGNFFCIEDSFCECDVNFFSSSRQILYKNISPSNVTNDALLPSLSLVPLEYCHKTEVSKKRFSTTTYSLNINPNSTQKITCWTQDIGDSSFLIIHRETIPLSQTQVIIDWGFGAITSHLFSTLDLPVEIPKILIERGTIITATDIEGTMAVASCLVEISGDKCYKREDSLLDYECASTTTKVIYWFLFSLILLGIILCFILLLKFFMRLCGCCFRMPITKKTSSMITMAFSGFIPSSQALDSEESYSLTMIILIAVMLLVIIFSFGFNIYTFIHNNFAKRHKSRIVFAPVEQENIFTRKPKPKTVLPTTSGFSNFAKLATVFFLCGAVMSQTCQQSYYFTGNNIVCTNQGNYMQCEAHTVVSSNLWMPGGSLCLSNRDPDYPFSVVITYKTALDVYDLTSLYYTSDYDVVVQRACICDAAGAGAHECESCDGQPDISLCNTDETDFISYPSTMNFCTYSTSGDTCSLSGSKIFSSTHLRTNSSTADYRIMESRSKKTYFSVDVEVQKNGITTVCNGIINNIPQELCGVLISTTINSSPAGPIGFAEVLNSENEYYFLDGIYNSPGNPTYCAPGMLQFSSEDKNAYSKDIIFGEYVKTSGVTYVDTGFFNCGSYQNFQVCNPSYNKLLPANTAYGYMSSTIYNDNQYIYTQNYMNPTLSLNIELAGNFTFNSRIDPVCPKVIMVGEVSGCYDCDGFASFKITALSSCFSGNAVVSCEGINILNPIITLSLEPQEFILSFKSQDKKVKRKCQVSATNTAKFDIEGELDSGDLVLANPTNGTITTEFMNTNKKALEKMKKDNNLIKTLEIIFGVLVTSLIFMLVIMAIIGCLGLTVYQTVIKKLI